MYALSGTPISLCVVISFCVTCTGEQQRPVIHHLLLDETPQPRGKEEDRRRCTSSARGFTTRGLSGLAGWSGAVAWPTGSPAAHRVKAAWVSRALARGSAVDSTSAPISASDEPAPASAADSSTSEAQGPFGPHVRRSLGGARRQAWRPGHGSGEAAGEEDAAADSRRRGEGPRGSGSNGRRRIGCIWPEPG